MKHFESFTLDTANECLWHEGSRITLPPKPFAVLRYLVENAGRLVSHNELLDAVWPEIYVQPQVLRTYMLDLRKLLGDDARNPRFIRSVPKRGYCFVAPVTDCPAVQDPEVAASTDPSNAPAMRTVLIGREAELSRLADAGEAAASEHRQFVCISGEAGVGKSALLDAFRRQLDPQFTVALGQCIPGFSAQDYYPLADAMGQIEDRPAAAAVRDLISSRAAAPGEICAAIERLARERPLALLLEDLQWADDATLHLLSALARRQGELRLLVLATVSPQTGTNDEALRALVHDLRIRRLCCKVNLSRLSRKALAAALAAHPENEGLPDAVHAFLFQNSEGNPRFAFTLLEHLKAEGVLVQSADTGEWRLTGKLEDLGQAAPRELAHSIEVEILRLGEREQRVLEAASIPSVAFPAWMVAAALDEDLLTVEEMCESLSRRLPFVQRAGEEELPGGTRSAFYVFAHTFYREVLYRRQSPARRALRHGRIARRLRELFRGQEALIALDAAGHYEAAGDLRKCAAMLRLAARRAIEMRAFGEAADLEARIAHLMADAVSGEEHRSEERTPESAASQAAQGMRHRWVGPLKA